MAYRGFPGRSLPKVMAVVIGGVLVLVLALKAPVESASPSTAAEHIVDARDGKGPNNARRILRTFHRHLTRGHSAH